jgi:dienelactone hydrolase
MKIWRKVVIVILAILIALGGGFVIWGESPAKAMPEAIAALQSDESVRVDVGDYLTFSPADQNYKTGFIFYPGGRVDYQAYAPMAHALAAEGFLVIIPRMPLNLAVFGINKAEQVIHAYPQVTHWVIGGHSLGGSMAAHYLVQHPDQIAGLVLLASYPGSKDDLTGYTGKVLSISGSLDGLATPAKINASKSLLPASAQYLVIQGGNHAYFGWYGDQPGDNAATITRKIEQLTIVLAILPILKNVSAGE